MAEPEPPAPPCGRKNEARRRTGTNCDRTRPRGPCPSSSRRRWCRWPRSHGAAARMPTPLYVPQVMPVYGHRQSAISLRPERAAAGAGGSGSASSHDCAPRADNHRASSQTGFAERLHAGGDPETAARPVRHERAALRAARRVRKHLAFPWKPQRRVWCWFSWEWEWALPTGRRQAAPCPGRNRRRQAAGRGRSGGARGKRRIDCHCDSAPRCARAARREKDGRNAGHPHGVAPGRHTLTFLTPTGSVKNGAGRIGEDAHPRRAGGLRMGRRVRADHPWTSRRTARRSAQRAGGPHALARTPRAHAQQPGIRLQRSADGRSGARRGAFHHRSTDGRGQPERGALGPRSGSTGRKSKQPPSPSCRCHSAHTRSCSSTRNSGNGAGRPS